VRPHDCIPLHRHGLKPSADRQGDGEWSLGAQLRGYSGQFVRGNENNRECAGCQAQFVAPGAPRAAWIGIRVEFGD
jgi:hypothetical protein